MSFLSKFSKIRIIAKSLESGEYHKFISGSSSRYFENVRKKHEMIALLLKNMLHSKMPDKEITVDPSEDCIFGQSPRIDRNNLVITIGGDGVFLKASRLIKYDDTFMMGINSQPNNSVGHFCTISIPEDEEGIKRVLNQMTDRIAAGDITEVRRARIKTKKLVYEGSPIEYPFCIYYDNLLALNEVFFGEILNNRCLRYAVALESKQFFIPRY